MEQEKLALLAGLKKYGRTKTFTEILNEAGYKLEPQQRLELANALEAEGLIKNVIYRLPLSIHADLSEAGEKLIADQNPDSNWSAGITGLLMLLHAEHLNALVPMI